MATVVRRESIAYAPRGVNVRISGGDGNPPYVFWPPLTLTLSPQAGRGDGLAAKCDALLEVSNLRRTSEVRRRWGRAASVGRVPAPARIPGGDGNPLCASTCILRSRRIA